MPERPVAVAFDVIETIFSLEPVRTHLENVGLPGSALELWFAQTLRDGFALTAAGGYQPFREVAAAALERLLRKRIDAGPASAEYVLAALNELEPHPDAEPAMRALKQENVRIVTLSNGSVTSTNHLLKRSGLDTCVERTFSIDEVKQWKPTAAPYQHTAKALGIEPHQLALVAVHAWDIMGAQRAGLTTGWVSRLEGKFSPVLGKPDVSGTSLVDVVESLLTLGG